MGCDNCDCGGCDNTATAHGWTVEGLRLYLERESLPDDAA